MVALAVKRLLDVVGALVLLVFAFPLMLWAMRAIRQDSPGGAIFRQVRIGQYGRPFVLYKLRTMRLGAERAWTPPSREDFDAYVFQDSDDDRVTPIGRFLRRASLDELPELINVLKGEMSLVGPRPDVPEMVALYRPFMERRHRLKPGLTGLAQVSGRGSLTTGEIMAYDLQYCDRWSLWLDFWILVQTVRQLYASPGR